MKQNESIRGQIAITEEEVMLNKMGWNEFDFFREILKQYTDKPCAGWYAYKLEDGIYYFLWEEEFKPLLIKYLKALHKDGYTIFKKL